MAAKDTPITDDQRKVLEIKRNHPGATPKDILGMIDDPDLGIDYVNHVYHNFALPDESTNNPDKEEIMNEVADNQPDDPERLTDGDIEDYRTRAERNRPLGSLSTKSKQVIGKVRDDPSLTRQDLKSGDYSPSLVTDAVKKYSHLIPTDAEIWETVQNPEDARHPDEIGSDLSRTIVETIRDDPTLEKDDVADKAGCSTPNVTTVMQMYRHLLPTEWCKRFNCLEGTGKITGGNKARHEQQNRLMISEDSDVEIDDEGEPPESWVSTLEHRDLEAEKDRMDQLNNCGVISDEDYEQRMEIIAEHETDEDEKLTEELADAEDTTPEEIESGAEEVEIEPPEEAELEADNPPEDMGSALADMSEDLEEREGEWLYDTESVDMLRQEISTHELCGSPQRESYADGIRHALTVLGIDTEM